jgi:hypothetical protein
MTLYFLYLGGRLRKVVKAKSRPSCPRERDLVPVVQEAGRATRPVWTAAVHVAPTGVTKFFQNILKIIYKKFAADQYLLG